jgi:hypothetical protein
MSKRQILDVCTLAAHLAQSKLEYDGSSLQTVTYHAPDAAMCAADAMRLQKLGARARRNALKRWIPPDARDTREEIQPYLDECARIDREVKAVLSPYGLTRVMVHRDGIMIEELPGKFGI